MAGQADGSVYKTPPLIARFVEGAPDAGLEPDIEVTTTLQDIVEGQDPELNRVRMEVVRGISP